MPFGPGKIVDPSSCSSITAAGDPDPDGGFAYDVVTVTTDFAGVPVNIYTATILIDGGYYGGGAEDVLVVFDASLRFTTGGGTYVHPGTDERVNFGYTMKFNKKRTNVRGSLLVIRHTPDGVYRLKSNRVEGLALGSEDEFGWASFAGKATYKEPDWGDAIGNYEFIAYVEDHDTPGAGADRFWVTAGRDGEVAAGLAMAPPAALTAELLTGGNIVVPHQGRGR